MSAAACELPAEWLQLPKDKRDELLEEHRYWNVDVIDWYDCVEDTFKDDMAAIGIHVETMYFSGFSSQGDGACFEGTVSDWPKFLASVNIEDPVLVQHLTENGGFRCTHSGCYYHENCTRFIADFELPDNDEDQWWADRYGTGEEFRDAVLLAALSKYDHDVLESQFTETFKSHMWDLYSRLEEDYYYLTSDEAVIESLIANNIVSEAIEELNAEQAEESAA
jgi:hypothetical protein